MRKFLLLTVSVLILTSCGTSYVPANIDPVEKTIQVDGSKKDLYVKSRNWMIETFNNSTSVMHFADKEEGIVTGKYLLSPGSPTANPAGIYAVFMLQTKDNSAKITIKPSEFNAGKKPRNPDAPRGVLDTPELYTKEEAVSEINYLINSYEKYLKEENLNW